MSKPVLEDIFTFQGRRNRKSFIFINLFVLFPVSIILIAIIALCAATMNGQDADAAKLLIAIAAGLFFIPIAVASYAVSAQRLHDAGQTGWFNLIYLIPYVGSFMMVVLAIIKGDVGDNVYGPDPLA